MHAAPPQTHFPAAGLPGGPLTLGPRPISERRCGTQVVCEDGLQYANCGQIPQMEEVGEEVTGMTCLLPEGSIK